MLILADLRKI